MKINSVQSGHPSQIKLESLQMPKGLSHQTSLRSLEGISETKRKDGFSETFIVRFFQKIWYGFRVFINDIFCCGFRPVFLYKNVQSTLKDGSQIVEYKSLFSGYVGRFRINNEVSWLIDKNKGNSIFPSKSRIGWENKVINDLKTQTKCLAVQVKNWYEANRFYRNGFRFNMTDPKSYAGNESKKTEVTLSSGGILSKKSEYYLQFITQVGMHVVTLGEEKRDVVKKVGEFIKLITKQDDLDVNDIRAIKSTWLEHSENIGDIKLDLNQFIEFSFSLYRLNDLFNVKNATSDVWPRVMELDLS